jgi:imidazolonepropionase-like amidohydrolase
MTKHTINLRGLIQNLFNTIIAFVLLALAACSSNSSLEFPSEQEGTFLVFRRQSQIGKVSYTISKEKESIIVSSLQGENERGRITGVQAIMNLNEDLTPTFYVNRRISNNDTIVNFKMTSTEKKVTIQEKKFAEKTSSLPEVFFPVHSNLPAAMEMMLYHYYFKKGKPKNIKTLPRGIVSIKPVGEDIVKINGKSETLYRYVVEGINWGGRTVWLNHANQLVAIVKANTQIREIIREGYEDALPVFVQGNVNEQIKTLQQYTKEYKIQQAEITALIGGDIFDGLTDQTKRDMTLLIENGKIKTIGARAEIEIPSNSKVIDVSGKTLIPGLWDMHAHSNQVQWAPAYLAGGITTIRDNGNEIELATAFRDEIDLNGGLGPDILLAGMTDGAGVKGNGAIRVRNVEEAKQVVANYHNYGYKQIKIYNSVKPEIVKVLSDEAHQLGLSVTGHVPSEVGNTVSAVELGMDQFSHSGLFLSVLLPHKTISELGRGFLQNQEVSPHQIDQAIEFLLKHKTVLDPTIALQIIRSIPKGTPIESVEPDAHRIAYELWEGKRFRNGLSVERSEKAIQGYTREMDIIGQFYKAGVPIVAGTDNVVPVFSLYLEIETYHKLGKLSPFEALKTATIIPAKAMGLEKVTGTLEIGKEADIAILDKNPLEDIRNIRTVSAVLTNGNYFESNPLWQAADFKPRNKN